VWARNLVNLYVSPLSTAEHLTGMVLCGLARVMASTAVLAVLSWVLYGFGVFTLGPALLPYVATLLAMAWALGVFAIGLVVRFGGSAQAFAWLLAFAVQPFAAVFYPVSVLPGAVQAMAQAVPASYIFEDMRSVLAGAHPSGGRLALAALLDVVYLSLAMAFLHRALRQARVSGRLSRFYQ
jgi:ABC-2 type transport system permease protein